jgi:Rieske Fe-S protein
LGFRHFRRENVLHGRALRQGAALSLRAVQRGQGKVLDLNGETVAVYRSEDGQLTMRSPVCTHMGCLVNWNEAERTWDCPCHGSRFKPTGEVIAGPAESALGEADGLRIAD